jgi:hypothetical protein
MNRVALPNLAYYGKISFVELTQPWTVEEPAPRGRAPRGRPTQKSLLNRHHAKYERTKKRTRKE